MKLAVALLLAGLLSGGARAEVVEAQADGFKIKQMLIIAAPPEKVYGAFVDIGSWWAAEHTYSGNSANLHIDARPGGCFCEALPDGGGIVHMTLVNVMPGKRLTLSGALGPLQIAGVAGAMTVQLLPKDGGTQFGLLYNVGGYFPGGLKAIAGDVDAVLTLQVQRLKRFVETGAVADPKATAKP
ncbi:MAG: polyketide cyclase/dehydrase-family protein [Nevskia sp.]|nr:polyketide cyclase/dehydrase-family protein [Nevskia sp.]